MLQMPTAVAEVLNRIIEHGEDAYVTGGALRDVLLEEMPADWDISAAVKPAQLARLFPEGRMLNDDFGTLTLDVKDRRTGMPIYIDIASFRIESVYSDRRRPDSITFTDSLFEDLARRDYTINAMAWHPEKGLVDPFSGKHDAQNKIVRAIRDPMGKLDEDPVRILRGIRLATGYGFEIESETLEAMREKRNLLSFVSRERIRQEFGKILTCVGSDKGFSIALNTGVLAQILMLTENAEYDGFYLLSERLKAAPGGVMNRWALIFACMDEQQAYRTIDSLRFTGTDAERFKIARDVMWQIGQAEDAPSIKRLIAKMGIETYQFAHDTMKSWEIISGAGMRKAREREKLFNEIEMRSDPIFLSDLEISGADLIENNIVASGEAVGKILDALLTEVHKTPDLNRKEDLLQRASELSAIKS